MYFIRRAEKLVNNLSSFLVWSNAKLNRDNLYEAQVLAQISIAVSLHNIAEAMHPNAKTEAHDDEDDRE